MSLSKPNKNDEFTMKDIAIPAVKMVEGQLPSSYMGELNSYIDKHRGDANDYSNHLVGQIKQNERSAQLDLDMKAPVIKSLIDILQVAGKRLIHSYSDTIPIKENDLVQSSLDCFSIWTVHSYAGDYNPLHDHDVSYDKKVMSLSCILYCKVPPQIEESDNSNSSFYENSGISDGYTQFVWGANTSADYLTLRPRQDKFIKPEEGKFLIFPCLLKHSVMPFYGNGERRTLSANFKTEYKLTKVGREKFNQLKEEGKVNNEFTL